MANVKITDLTALAGADAVDTDVFVVVDISADQTKKITKAELVTATSAANDFVTFTQLNANLNTVSSNAAAVETRRVANIAGAISTVLTSDLTASRALVTNGDGKIAVSDVTSAEIDHLDGKLFVDYISNMKRERIAKKIKKLTKEGKLESRSNVPYSI